jgi:hypothetical protein
MSEQFMGGYPMEKFYCKQCCQIYSEKTVCPQCHIDVEGKINIHVQNGQGNKKNG